jgi:hypothetical protein
LPRAQPSSRTTPVSRSSQQQQAKNKRQYFTE